MSNCNTLLTVDGKKVQCGTELFRDGDSDGITIVRATCTKCKKEIDHTKQERFTGYFRR